MLRQLLWIVALVALFVALGLLLMSRLGWWPRAEVAPPVATAPAPPPVPTQPLQPPAAQGVPAPVPPLPEFGLAPEAATSPSRPAPAVPEPEFSLAPDMPPPAPTPPMSVPPPVPTAQLGSTPLDTLNSVRALAGLPPVQHNNTWDAECQAHAAYLLATDTGSHSEDPANPHYSAAGAACASGHYFVTMRPDASVSRAVNYWMTGPFHLPQLLDPRLREVGFAVLHDLGGDVRTAAVLDLQRGRTGPAAYPVKFPAPNKTVGALSLSEFEYPDSLPTCAGYVHPVGAPIALLQGSSKTATAGRLKVGGQEVQSCLLTAETFVGGYENDTRVGRSVLSAQGVSVLLPRHPLPSGAKVSVSFKTAAGEVAWSFSTR